ncbi:hypothetical protein [Empedobacter brevis]|uniref:hypothetical protein n=1 Tax=Empedobacter brevis TaxID=247 RepID=UPI00333F9AA3
MQVKRRVLQNLSTNELLLYIRDDSRFVPEAIGMAFEILKHERNIDFSKIETTRIQNLIYSKTIQIEKEKRTIKLEPNLVEDIDENSEIPRLYSKRQIAIHSSIVFSFIGAILLYQNLKKIKEVGFSNYFVLVVFSISMLVFDYYLYEYMVNHEEQFNQIRRNRLGNLGIFFTIRGLINYSLISIIWSYFFGKNFKYREVK